MFYVYIYIGMTSNGSSTCPQTRCTETCSGRGLWRMPCLNPPTLTPAPKVLSHIYTHVS